VHFSISTKVTAACTAVLVPSLLLLASGLKVGAEVGAANEHIDHLSRLLRVQDDQDRAQRTLRLSLGETTRIAEQHDFVSDIRWAQLGAELQAFKNLSAAPLDTSNRPLPAEVYTTLTKTRDAALDFVPIGQQLVRTARRDPNALKAAMPKFLNALKRLEAERTDAREAFGRAIGTAADHAVDRNRHGRLLSLTGALAVIVALLALAIWLRLRVIRPIVAIAAMLRAFRSNRPVETAVPGLDRQDEVGDLAHGVSEYHEAVEAQRVAQRQVDFLAHHDALTGLPNRLQFENRLSREIAQARRTGGDVAIFAIDMDEFKSINDRCGHAGGDDALRRAANLLSGCIRDTDLVARTGGDEFAIIQVAPTQPAAAEALLRRIECATAGTAEANVPIRMSIGIAVSTDNQDGEELHKSADIALYRAKSDGRNTSRFFDRRLQNEVELRHRLERDLERAIDASQLYVVFQPIATPSGQVTGFEALLRWLHPDLGAIAPDMFIPIAEATGQIGRIGIWVAERVFSTAAVWSTEYTVSLNLSPIQFRNPNLGSILLDLAARHGIAPGRLEFEVTESATLLGQHRRAVLATLRQLQTAGAMISMDDFGTGHSSLSNLKDFSFDKLKIDQSFVSTMLSHAPSAVIVKATIGLGRSLGMSIVAEGVETAAQLNQLRDWGCDQVQGYYIGRPVRQVGCRHVAEDAETSEDAVVLAQIS